MSLPKNQAARRIGNRNESGATEQIDRFAVKPAGFFELRFWKGLLSNLLERKDRLPPKIRLSDDRFCQPSANESKSCVVREYRLTDC